MMAVALRSGAGRLSNGSRTTNIVAKLGLLACSTNDVPEIAIVWATPGVRAGDRLDPGHGLLGPLQRRRVGQLDVADDPALVLLRDEARGRLLEDPAGQHEQAAVDQQDEHAAAQQPAHHPAVARGAGAEDPVEQPEEPAEQPCPAARSAGRGVRCRAA